MSSDLDSLIWEYKIGLRHARIMQKKVKYEADETLLRGIVISMSESVKYMQTGISMLDYKRESNYEAPSIAYYSDMAFVSHLKHKYESQKSESKKISDFETALINELLNALTPRQKDIFLLVNKSGFSIKSTARMLNLKRKTVEDHLRKAEKKIEEQKKKSQLWQLMESEKNE
ncbi:sigma factor-like helix-turn-helix DNA-binding protein [Listeria seeligeri]|uniref:sigma factor-like helix-turn-helix DNA-binding protein n=1 Tax=Listeria seeligeri TaxID=1640 RepID=UPI0001C4EC82|nr:sigma factor-like helix-turn-helix DNA-binding protein [Listeria seeligeri]CBH27770.1 LuxR-type HTH domain protein [Listeria seeligeri serovar 1/2b str. SLCC3954]